MLNLLYLLDVPIGPKFLLRPGLSVEEKFGTLGGLLSIVLQFILGVAAFLMFLFLIIGGLRYIFSGGDEKAVAAARGQITIAIAGFLVIFFSYAIILLIERLTGLCITGLAC